jgi:DNA-binding CsgD family transcriptional regulator
VLTAPLKTIPLSRRQVEIIRLISRGMRDEEIAKQIGIGVGTVRSYMQDIFYKLRVKTRQQAGAKWMQVQRERRLQVSG